MLNNNKTKKTTAKGVPEDCYFEWEYTPSPKSSCPITFFYSTIEDFKNTPIGRSYVGEERQSNNQVQQHGSLNPNLLSHQTSNSASSIAAQSMSNISVGLNNSSVSENIGSTLLAPPPYVVPKDSVSKRMNISNFIN